MLSSPGIGSGLDVNAIVDRMLAFEQRPLLRLDSKEAGIQAQISAFGEIKSAMAAFQSEMERLGGADSFRAFSADSSDQDVLTASASSGAAKGTFNIDVSRIAENHRMAANTVFADTDATLVGTAGETITITTGQGSTTVEFGGKTLAEIRDDINAATTNPGVTASILKDDTGYHLTLSADSTGSSGHISSVAYSGADPFDLQTLNADRDGDMSFSAADLDAVLVVEGQFTVTSGSNSVSGAIEGVTLELAGAGATTLTIDSSPGAVRVNVQAFVDAYNELMSTVRAQREGALGSDSATITNIESQLRGILNTPADTGGVFSYLSEIGVRSTRDGTLEIDDNALDAALQDASGALPALFTADNQGFAVRFAELANAFVGTGGTIGTRLETLNNRVTDIAEERVRLETRLADTEERLLQQFGALDSLVASLNATSNFLAQQLQNLPSPGGSNR